MAGDERLFSEKAVETFLAGESLNAYELFGCHYDAEVRVHSFSVFAPGAKEISVVGDFNGWRPNMNPMVKDAHGIWRTEIGGLIDEDNYKYLIRGYDGSTAYKADPFAYHEEAGGEHASKIWDIAGYEWHDNAYMQNREKKDSLLKPLSIYELHLGSWRKKDGHKTPQIREIADELAEYLCSMAYTHVELMPIMEYPKDETLGYHTAGYFAVTSRYGTPEDYMYFMDRMHERGIGIIISFVPACFSMDEHGLSRFDGTYLFEHEDGISRAKGAGACKMNYARPEVRSFLNSCAMFYIKEYHVDGINVSGVPSMVYRQMEKDGYYVPGQEDADVFDADGIFFLKAFTQNVAGQGAGAITVARDGAVCDHVTADVSEGGLGFTYKWDNGFAADSLAYMETLPKNRHFYHEKLLYASEYAFSENFILPYPHDVVTANKKSMIEKMPGEFADKFASLKSLYGFMFAHPGKKLMFMGDELGQFLEWDASKQLDWFLLDLHSHAGMKRYVKKLNKVYRKYACLYKDGRKEDSFRWIVKDDAIGSVFCFMRIMGEENMLCIFNFLDETHDGYKIAPGAEGTLRLVFCSDDAKYGGEGRLPEKTITAVETGFEITLPPLCAAYYEFVPAKKG